MTCFGEDEILEEKCIASW